MGVSGILRGVAFSAVSSHIFLWRDVSGFMMPTVPSTTSVFSSATMSTRSGVTTSTNAFDQAAAELSSTRVHGVRRSSRTQRTSALPQSKLGRLFAGASDSSSTGRAGKNGTNEPVIFAQEALDKAWRSKRRVEMGGKEKRRPLKERFLSALVSGYNPTAFVSDREFMESTLDSVVRIYCTHSFPSWSMPWQRLKQEQSSSTGFLIDGRRIITNAHSVEYSTMVQLRRRGSDKKFQATRLAVGEECDLAILTVEDEEFWQGTSPMTFGTLPELTDDVNVIGYPVGGECVSITAGVVSRVEMTVYAQAEHELLSIQIDAAINPGNSGGPVVNDNGEVVGVAFQTLDGEDVESIGYVVPVNVLEHFLEDVSRHGGNYKGFPRLGVDLQNLENPALREKLEMSSKQTGVLIKRVEPLAPVMNFISKGDVMMKVDGIKIANDGSIPFRSGERVSLRYYMSQLFPDDEVVVELLRGNAVKSVTVPLFVGALHCPMHFSGRPPSYFVLGGLVFTVMSDPYVEEQREEGNSGTAHFVELAQTRLKNADDENIVIMSQVLAHESNVGYEGMENMELLSFNSVRVRSLNHLVRLADKSTERFLYFEFSSNRTIVLEAADVPGATKQICKDNSIPFPRSADLLEKLPSPSAKASASTAANGTDEGKRKPPPQGANQPGGAPIIINGSPKPSADKVVPTTTLVKGAAQKCSISEPKAEVGVRAKNPWSRSRAGLRSAASAAVKTVSRGVESLVRRVS